MKPELRIAVLLSAVMTMTAGNKAAATTWTVDVSSFSFSPKNLTIQAGDIVRWQRVSGTHTTTSGESCVADQLWDAPIDAAHTSFQGQFNSVGNFPYFCRPHCGSGMTGTINVEMVSGVFDEPSGEGLPRSFALQQNYPNPFNASTVISYELAKEGHITLEVFDVLGRIVTTLVDEIQPVGRHEISWDGHANGGALVPSGIYFYRLTAPQEIESREMILLK